jgi:hypothetical protein
LKTLRTELANLQDLHRRSSDVNIENAILKEQSSRKDEKILLLESDVEALRDQKRLVEAEAGKRNSDADYKISVLNSKMNELEEKLIIAENSLQVSQHSDNANQDQIQLLNKMLQEMATKQKDFLEETSALQSELRHKFEVEAQKQIQERTFDLQHRLTQMVLTCQQAEKSLNDMEISRRESLEATEIQHSTAIDKLKRDHQQIIERLELEHQDNDAKTKSVVEMEIKKSFDNQYQLLEQKHFQERGQFEKILRTEREKIDSLEQTVKNLKEEHAQQMRDCEKRAAEELVNLHRSLAATKDENYESLRSRLSQLQLENRNLCSQLSQTAESQNDHQASAQPVGTDEVGSSAILRNALPLDSQLDHLLEPKLNSDNRGENQGAWNLNCKQQLTVTSSKLLRLKDIAAMLEPTTSLELSSGISTMLDNVVNITNLDTPRPPIGHLEEMGAQFPQELNSTSGPRQTGLLTNPFLVKESDQRQQTETQTQPEPLSGDQNTEAIPFKLFDRPHEPFRSSAPPSTCGSIGSVSVLATKSRAQSQSRVIGTNNNHEARGSAENNVSGPSTFVQPLQFTLNDSHYDISKMDKQGMKRLSSSNQYPENIGKKRIAVSDTGKLQQVPLDDSTNGISDSQPIQPGEERFKVVGSPHIGQFPHNRPPTAKARAMTRTSSRGSQRRLLKRSEIMMVARFDQELQN